MNSPSDIQHAATELMHQAYKLLVEGGKTQEEAENIVKKNFIRINNNPNLILNIPELCKSL